MPWYDRSGITSNNLLSVRYALKSKRFILDLGAGGRVYPGATHAIDLHGRTEPGVEYIAVNVEKARIPIADDFFDFVISRGALLIAFGNLHTYREIYRVLKPGGKLVFMFGMYPSAGSWARAYINLKIAGFTDIRKKVKPWSKRYHTFSRTITAYKSRSLMRNVIRARTKSSQATLS